MNTTEVAKSKAAGQSLKHIARIPRNYITQIINSKPQEHAKVLNIFKFIYIEDFYSTE